MLDAGDRFFSAEVPEGRVHVAGAGAGCEVRRGWRVRVAREHGSAARGDSRPRGRQRARRRDQHSPPRPRDGQHCDRCRFQAHLPDQIVAQSPPANATNVSAPKISVLLASPEERAAFVMPDLVGRSEDEAINAIVQAGFKVGSITSQAAPSDSSSANDIPSGLRMVTHTSPGAGQRVYEGQGIALEVTR